MHIADVSHYVTEGSIIDREAQKRATSVYLVDRTIPMLPERLCNFICSLRPDEDKLAFSVIFLLDEDAMVRSYRIVHTIIRSNRRYAYEEVQQLLEDNGVVDGTNQPAPAPGPKGYKGENANELITLDRLAKRLREARFKNGAVRFDHVCFRYKDDGRDVLSDISLNIRSGETVGIIGGTGSSKTSLVQLLPRLYDTTAGHVYIGGEDVRNYDLDTLRNSVAMVLQKNELFSGTIADNLRWGNKNATQQELEDACKQACADEFIERFPDKYETHIDQGGANVSGGQKQRLCIARALLKKPKILILDDSTSAVDTATDAKIRRSFAEKIPGTTVFIIAQRISSVENADKVLVLDGGRVSGFGTPAEMLATNPIYQEVYNSQTQGSGDFDEKGGEA